MNFSFFVLMMLIESWANSTSQRVAKSLQQELWPRERRSLKKKPSIQKSETIPESDLR